MTNFALSVECEPDNFENLYFEFYALFHIQFLVSLTNRNTKSMSLEYREIRRSNISSFFSQRCPRRRRQSDFNSLTIINTNNFTKKAYPSGRVK